MKIVIIGSGMMGSAMAVPALDNGHTVTLAGTPLDTEIIDGLKQSNYHKTLKHELKGDISFRQFEEIKGNIPECDIFNLRRFKLRGRVVCGECNSRAQKRAEGACNHKGSA